MSAPPNGHFRPALTEQAKQEILELFSEESDTFHEWTEQDIYEQSRKIIARWDQV